jgi:3-isopropylmalate dehydrogenase
MTHRIAVIKGDGIGPEVVEQALRVLDVLRRERGVDVELWELPLGAELYLKNGTTFPRELRDEVQSTCSAVLLGAVGDPRVPDGEHAHDILIGMRNAWDLYANVRPVRALTDALVPLKGKSKADVDIVIYRENTEGQYIAAGHERGRGRPDEIAISREVHTRHGVERLLRAAYRYARERARPLLMTDKSNAIPAQRIWRRVLAELALEFADVPTEQLYVDALAARLIQAPERHGVIAASNLFGDILADQCAALAGGLGLAPSANLHPAGTGSYRIVRAGARVRARHCWTWRCQSARRDPLARLAARAPRLSGGSAAHRADGRRSAAARALHGRCRRRFGLAGSWKRFPRSFAAPVSGEPSKIRPPAWLVVRPRP